jgi:phenylacetate-CoA ligase
MRLNLVRERTLLENGRRFKDCIARVSARVHQGKSKSLLQKMGLMKQEYVSVHESTTDQIRLLKKIKPDIINGYPSSIKLLAMALQEHDLQEICPRLIFTFAELLDTDSRNLINSVFCTDIFDYYSSMEAGVMAWECKEHSGYHMNIDSVVMEFVDENNERVDAGEKGEIIITNLNSKGMPFIRYKIGDKGSFIGDGCPCGRGLPLMDMIEGRSDDFVRSCNGFLLSPLVITDFMRQFSGSISDFRMIQEKEDVVKIELVERKNISDDIIFQIKEKFKEMLGEEMCIEPKIVKEIASEKSGKRRAVISKI